MAPERQVRMGELAVSDDASETLITLGLGSCIGLALVDRRRRNAALAHIVLPDSENHSVDRGGPAKYADLAVPLMLDQLMKLGSPRVALEAVLVGGARMFDLGPNRSSMLDVGARNALAVRELLERQRIPVTAEDTGGTRGRTIRVQVGDARVTTRHAGGDERDLLLRPVAVGSIT